MIIGVPKEIKKPREPREKTEKPESFERKENEGSVENQLRAIIKEFIVASKLNVNIKTSSLYALFLWLYQ